MLNRTNESDPSSTFPRPELNPLLNSLLGENMGRWAEVYYTSAPEKRQEAVLELLRELELEQTQRETATTAEGTIDDAGSEAYGVQAPLDASDENSVESNIENREEFLNEEHSSSQEDPAGDVQLSSIHCRSCGHENPGDQKFCGMCGVPLTASAVAPSFDFDDSPHVDAPPIDSPYSQRASDLQEHPQEHWTSDPHTGSAQESSPADSFFEQISREEFFPATQPGAELAEARNPQARNDDYPRNMFFLHSEEDEPRSHYRLYLGGALAVIILALGYVAWRNGQTNSAAGQLAPQAPPAATEQQPVESRPTAPASADTKSADAKSEAPTADTSKPETPTPSSRQTGIIKAPIVSEAMPPAKPRPAASIAKESAVKPAQPQTSAGTGAQELAVAEQYLNGTNGQPRNSAAAVQWLWKAVEKRNTEATMLLSDLYLRGNGVQKNCDQAHVLLDAAASRGVRDAAERLRNLRAFGCE